MGFYSDGEIARLSTRSVHSPSIFNRLMQRVEIAGSALLAVNTVV